MNSTSSSLLEQLRQPDATEAWDRFVQLYTPLLYHWARGAGLRREDAADLVQEVLVLLVRKMPEFQYDRRKSFRAWLRTITLNKWREKRRRTPSALAAGADALEELAAPDEMAAFEEAEYRRVLVQQALRVLREEFPDRTWQAFWRYAVEGQDAAVVAEALGLRVASVYAARSRVVARLRQNLEGLVD
jgi:RNA polymerase sigma-70 factor (ECF subfamily)